MRNCGFKKFRNLSKVIKLVSGRIVTQTSQFVVHFLFCRTNNETTFPSFPELWPVEHEQKWRVLLPTWFIKSFHRQSFYPLFPTECRELQGPRGRWSYKMKGAKVFKWPHGSPSAGQEQSFEVPNKLLLYKPLRIRHWFKVLNLRLKVAWVSCRRVHNLFYLFIFREWKREGEK